MATSGAASVEMILAFRESYLPSYITRNNSEVTDMTREKYLLPC